MKRQGLERWLTQLKSIGCSLRGPVSVTPATEDPTPLLVSMGTASTWSTDILAGKTLIHTK